MRPDGERESFPKLRQMAGEDPARFLGTDMDPEPRIQGITDLGVANAWLQAAKELDVDSGTYRTIEQRRDAIIRNQP